MSIPEQVKKQVEVVEEMYKKMAEENTENTENMENTENIENTENTENTENIENIENTEITENAENIDDEKTYEQRYKTLQGMYNAEVPRLKKQNNELLQRVQQLEQLLATVSTQQPTEQQTEQQTEKYITEKDIEEYGESIDIMRKVAREELYPLLQQFSNIKNTIDQFKSSIIPQVQNIARRQHMSAEQQFWADLATAIPNFREINDNPQFQSWLLETDPLTGITRQTYLEDAQRNLDAQRVINIFRAWMSSNNSTNSTANRTAVSELEKQIAPGRSKNHGVSVNNPKIYTPQDIAKFYNDVRAGKYRGREQERNRIEHDIFTAQKENRIQFR